MKMVEGPKLKPISPHIGQLVGYVNPERSIDETELERKWYVLTIQPRHEKISAAHLIGRGFRVYLPELPQWKFRGVRRTWTRVLVAMFPCYSFLALDVDREGPRMRFIHATPGVRGFLRLEYYGYATIDDDVIEWVRKIEREAMAQTGRTRSSKWKVGQRARIASGPFEDRIVAVTDLDMSGKITVELPLFGRPVPVHLAEDDLLKL